MICKVAKHFNSGEVFGVAIKLEENWWGLNHKRVICAGTYCKSDDKYKGGFGLNCVMDNYCGGKYEPIWFETKEEAYKWIDNHYKIFDKDKDQFVLRKGKGEKNLIPCPIYGQPETKCWVRPNKIFNQNMSKDRRDEALKDYPDMFEPEPDKLFTISFNEYKRVGNELIPTERKVLKVTGYKECENIRCDKQIQAYDDIKKVYFKRDLIEDSDFKKLAELSDKILNYKEESN